MRLTDAINVLRYIITLHIIHTLIYTMNYERVCNYVFLLLNLIVDTSEINKSCL